ncbi:hypothetical protein BCV70DRAFT_45221 [Testicularia cyperi]|uniref:Uncharacterized protein n=1 Tax=Testicularia cyperi TaxID=1882483 RepID=A0A317XHL8_9BASI|nr:hypothetical protein BCV70DRAFT_45221 [Testicularia cyperi]
MPVTFGVWSLGHTSSAIHVHLSRVANALAGQNWVALSQPSYCTVLYCTVLYCTVLYCTVLYHRTVPCCAFPACVDTTLHILIRLQGVTIVAVCTGAAIVRHSAGCSDMGRCLSNTSQAWPGQSPQCRDMSSGCACFAFLPVWALRPGSRPF